MQTVLTRFDRFRTSQFFFKVDTLIHGAQVREGETELVYCLCFSVAIVGYERLDQLRFVGD